MRQLKITERITDKDSDGILQRYFNDISKIPLLTTEEEIGLGKQIKEDNNKQAIDKLVKSNLRFVISVAKQYQHQGLDLFDLISEGNCGLIKAASKRDYSQGFKFISLAVWYIRNSIINGINTDKRLIRLPLNKIGQISHIEKNINMELLLNNLIPSSIELSEKLQLPLKATKEMLTLILNKDTITIDSLLEKEFIINENNGVNHNTMSYEILNTEYMTDKILIDESTLCDIERVLSTLTPKEADVIRLFFGLGDKELLSLDQIGEELHLTSERIRQIKEKAIRRMKHTSRNNILRKYLG